MENKTLEFHILPFFLKFDSKFFVCSVVFFFLIYGFGILVNTVIITAICWDVHLHTPMYLFLCNLAVVDLCYITVTVPKLLHMLLSGKNTVVFVQCFMQIYFFFIAASAEVTVIFIMAYDRYVAICHPLYYHNILNRKKCILLMMATWVFALVNSSLFTNSTLKMSFCSSVTIHQFFCDAKALINISCRGREMFYVVVYANCFVLGFCPIVCNLMSYVQIIRVILQIKSKDGRSKAFSTCSSHLIVMAIYYGAGLSVYLTPPSDRYDLLEQILTVFYTTVVPILNPLIYSLRNNEVKNSLRKLLSWST